MQNAYPRNDREAHLILSTPRVTPAWQQPAPYRAAAARPSTLRRILRALFGE